MRILLTSAGISSNHIGGYLNNLSRDTNRKIGFISTAANVESGNKDWFINQFINLWRHGFNWIDVIDISAPEVNWKERLSEVDIVFISGGNTFHLLEQVYKTGFDLWVKEMLDKKIFVGVSAGSIIMTPKINIASVDDGDENKCGLQDLTGLCLVDFEFSPHTRSCKLFRE